MAPPLLSGTVFAAESGTALASGSEARQRPCNRREPGCTRAYGHTAKPRPLGVVCTVRTVVRLRTVRLAPPMREEHKMPQVRKRRIGPLAVAVVLISLRLAHATGAGIQDAAGFFSKDAIATAEHQITAIHQKFGKDLRVETYAHIPTDRADQYVPEKRHEFFATWAYQRAKALGLDGVIVLICKDPAFLQVEVGERTKQ